MPTTCLRAVKISLVIGLASLLGLTTFSSLVIRAAGSASGTSAAEPSIALARMAGTLPNGVAAGDVTQTSAMLWTRGTTVGNVLFEYSADPGFSAARSVTATATVTDLLQPVKVALRGLTSATEYVYRVTDASDASAEGQFRTAAAIGTRSGLRFGVSGDWDGKLAPYPAIANADERALDFFIEHSDTIVAASAETLAEFRLKHNEVYSNYFGLNTWADLRASTSILATIDDNEVRNNFAGGAAASTDSRFPETSGFINETQLYDNGLQAFQEYNPLRDEFYGATGEPRTADKRKLYRFNIYGSDAAAFILDTRSFRDEPLPEPTNEVEVLQFLARSLTDTGRTMLGAQQLSDLKADLQQVQDAGITWKFVLVSSPIQNLGVFLASDRYEGYAAERTNLLRFISENRIENVVFIAASLHGTIVNNLTYQETVLGPQIPAEAFEVIVGPVATGPPAGPFGPAVVDLAEDFGLITPADRADYEARSRQGKDEFIEDLMNDLITPFSLNYDPIGLDGSGIEATVLQGGYVAVHTYGWTEFEIGQSTQVLTVTTYGIDFYTEDDLATNPAGVITRTPTVVSQFTVVPKPKSIYLPLLVKDV